MATNSEQNNPQEIDLFVIFKRIGSAFDRMGLAVYRFVRFLMRNYIIISIIIIGGLAAGYFLDQNKKELYSHEIVVVPNFGSLEYLYNKVENANLKGTPIKSMEVEPIVDVYEFSKERWVNTELLKTLYTNNVFIDKYKEGSNVEKFYRYHLVKVITKKRDIDNKIIDSLLDDMNKGIFFSDRQKVEKVSREREIAEFKTSINYINGILEKLGSASIPSANLNVEMYSDLNNLIGSKRSMVEDIGKNEISLIEQSKVIYDTSRVTNIKVKETSKLVSLPFNLFLLFLLFSLLRKLFFRYRKIEAEK